MYSGNENVAPNFRNFANVQNLLGSKIYEQTFLTASRLDVNEIMMPFYESGLQLQ